MTDPMPEFLRAQIARVESATATNPEIWYGSHPEIEAKHLIIAEHDRSECRGHDGPWISHGAACTYECTGCHGDYLCATLRIMAAVYSDRPGYREEWRPA